MPPKIGSALAPVRALWVVPDEQGAGNGQGVKGESGGGDRQGEESESRGGVQGQPAPCQGSGYRDVEAAGSLRQGETGRRCARATAEWYRHCGLWLWVHAAAFQDVSAAVLEAASSKGGGAGGQAGHVAVLARCCACSMLLCLHVAVLACCCACMSLCLHVAMPARCCACMLLCLHVAVLACCCAGAPPEHFSRWQARSTAGLARCVPPKIVRLHAPALTPRAIAAACAFTAMSTQAGRPAQQQAWRALCHSRQCACTLWLLSPLCDQGLVWRPVKSDADLLAQCGDQ